MADNENKQPEVLPGDALEPVDLTAEKTQTAADIIKDIAKDIIFSTADLAHQYSRDHGAEITPELYRKIRTDITPTRNSISHPQPNQDELLEQARVAIITLLPQILDYADSLSSLSKRAATDDAGNQISMLLSRIRSLQKNYNLFLLALETEDLKSELEKELQNPKYDGRTLQELFEEITAEQGEGELDGTSLFEQAIEAARKAKYPAATIRRAKSIEFPLDKPNSRIWNLLEENTEGQVTFDLAKTGSRKVLLATYSIDFDALEGQVKGLQITKRLLIYDKCVYMAISALFNAGNNIVTLSQIYYAMGYTGRPGKKDLNKINQSITKMMTAHIFFDNEQESQAYKNYPHFKYDGSLLPVERGTYIVNGQLAEAAIKVFREPPLITFAKQRRQITTIDVKLLQSPISKTDMNLLINDYLIERISRAKNGKKKSCRILFKTLYEHARIADRPKTNTEKQAKKRAPEKVQKYLEFYQSQGFIKRFTVEPDGVTVHW